MEEKIIFNNEFKANMINNEIEKLYEKKNKK